MEAWCRGRGQEGGNAASYNKGLQMEAPSHLGEFREVSGEVLLEEERYMKYGKIIKNAGVFEKLRLAEEIIKLIPPVINPELAKLLSYWQKGYGIWYAPIRLEYFIGEDEDDRGENETDY